MKYSNQLNLALAIALAIFVNTANAQVGIGTTSPNSSAVLDLSSTNKGLLVPRMSSTQRLAISSPTKGLLVFDNDSAYFFYYSGSAWTGLKTKNYTSGNTALTISGTTITANNTVANWNASQLQGVTVNTTTPTNGQVLKYNSSTGKWEPGTDNNTSYSASDGLTLSGTSLSLGGNLTGATTLGTSSSNTLKLTGVQSGSGTDSLVVLSNGVVKKVAQSSTSQWTTSGSNIYNGNSGNVGIGKTSPSYKLDVSGMVNADSFSIGGTRFISSKGIDNTFIGNTAGKVNTASENTFTGYQAGYNNSTGNENNFYGALTGYNTTTGAKNTFYGHSIGYTNTTGSNNTLVGAFSDVGSNNLTNATAVGYGAKVNSSNSLILGNSARVGIGTSSPSAKVEVNGSIKLDTMSGTGTRMVVSDANGYLSTQSIPSSTTYSAGTGISISGSTINSDWTTSGSNVYNNNTGNVGIGKTSPSYKLDISGMVNADSFSIGGSRIMSTKGINNTLVGSGAGKVNTASENTFTGYQAGSNNSTGNENNFYGSLTGYNTTTGAKNTFYGHSTGYTNTTGNNNTLVGAFSDVGSNNLTNATAVGYGAKVNQSNSLILGGTGGNQPNVGIGTTAPNTSAILDLSSTSMGLLIPRVTASQMGLISSPATGLMVYNTDSNYFFYYNSGWNGIKSNSSTISSQWTTSGSNIYNGNSGNVGIGKTSPSYKLDVSGTVNADSFMTGGTKILIGRPNRDLYIGQYVANNAYIGASDNTIVGYNAGNQSTSGYQNTFLGSSAGYDNTTGYNNTFLGQYSGYNTTTGSANDFIGAQAGYGNTTGSYNTFIGLNTGYNNTTGTNNIFIHGGGGNTSGDLNVALGNAAGATNTTGSQNTFLGYNADATSNNFSNATAIGYNAKVGKSNAVVLGDTSNANVGIGTSKPNSSALLDLSSTSKGLLMPRMTESQMTAISSPATGLTVFNTDSGYVFFYNSGWKGIKSTSAITNYWKLSGGNIVQADTSKYIGIGKSSAAYQLDVTGPVNADSFMISSFTALYATNNLGGQNTYVGANAGYNRSGSLNTFVGAFVGQNNTGGSNVYIGQEAAKYSTTSSENTFVGRKSGYHTTTGGDNLFLGNQAGISNITGSGNTLIGSNSNVSSSSLTNATAIGNGATVSASNSLVLGNGANVGIGKSSPAYALDVTGPVNADSFMSGGSRVLLVNGSYNTFIGLGTGEGTTGIQNTMTGNSAGYKNTTGQANNFYGNNAGLNNTSGSTNNFYGVATGLNNTTGSNNTFIGHASGYSNTSSSNNTALGTLGLFSTTTGYSNTAVGTNAGFTNSTGSRNTLIGDSADVSTSGLTNATAIGYNATVSASNSIVLGNGANVGIGTSSPGYKLDVSGAINTDSLMEGGFNVLKANGSNTKVGITANNNISGSYNVLLGYLSGSQLTTGNNNFFAGGQAGYSNTSGSDNTFLGFNAGSNNTFGVRNTFIGSSSSGGSTGSDNIFIGYSTGSLLSSGIYNVGVGNSALSNITSQYGNTAIGNYAGYGWKGYHNTFIGDSADPSGDGYSNATAIGYNSRISQSNTIILGATGTNQPNVGVGTSTPNTSALMDLTSTSKGFLMPRMTESQMTSISSPSTGLMVYNTDSGYVFFYNSGWKGIKSDGALSATNYWSRSGTKTTLANSSDNVGIGKTPSYKLDISGFANADSFGIGGNTVLNAKGTNTVVGKLAGIKVSGSGNTYLGNLAGYPTTSGNYNLILGSQAGFANTTGSYNSFSGAWSGGSNTSGNQNTYSGYAAGYGNSKGANNAYVGFNAGWNNNGTGNTGLGNYAGYTQNTGTHNTFVGDSADASASGLTNATAIGYNAKVSTSNSLVLGNGANVGIGKSSPSYPLDVSGMANADSFSISGSTVLNVKGTGNTFMGASTGTKNTGTNNTFTGSSAGAKNSSGSFNAYFGYKAGFAGTSGTDNTLIGYSAGSNITSGSNDIVIGALAGSTLVSSSGHDNTIIGTGADVSSASLTNATAIGSNATVGASNSVVLGGTGTSACNVGIGTSTPGSLLDAQSSSAAAISVTSTSNAAYTQASANSGNEAALKLLTYSSGTSTTRWEVGKSNASETGSNAGSDYFINRYSDAGAYIGQPFYITRSSGNVGINNSSPKSTLHIGGSISTNRTAYSSSSTIASTDHIVAVTVTTAITMTLPDASTAGAGREYIIKSEKSTASITISTTSSQTIDGASSKSISSGYGALRVYSDGSNWFTY